MFYQCDCYKIMIKLDKQLYAVLIVNHIYNICRSCAKC